MNFQPPVIVVPGITASVLRDEYPVKPEEVWRLAKKAYERIALHPDDPSPETPEEPGPRYERAEPARVRADRVFAIPYEELIEELRHDLTRRADEPTPVYPFPYDWRQPLRVVEEDLARFIEEVVERTMLTRHYHRAGYRAEPRVDLVGHSMGGLVIAGYLEAHGGERVRKVATLATPFRGSFEAVIKVAVGTSNLSARSESSRERETARVTPAIYHLVPSIPEAVEAHGDLSEDLFEPEAWQPGVLETIVEYIRLYGLEHEEAGAVEEVKRERWRERARELFEGMLAAAAAHRSRVEELDLGEAGLGVDDWLCLVGVGKETRVGLRITPDEEGAPFFDLSSDRRKNGYLSPKQRREREERGEEVPELWGTGPCPTPAPSPPSSLWRSSSASRTGSSATGRSGTES